MRWFKVIFSIFLALVFTAFVLGKTTVLGVYDVVNDYNPGTGGLTAGQVCADGCPPSATSYGGSIFSGFYIAPNGNWYPIGNPVDPVTGGGGGGGGPAETGGVCTGVYGNCSTWGVCSTLCGSGTQQQLCYDTGCGAVQTNTQACNTSACPAWTKLKDSSYVSINPLFNMISLTPQAYDADDTTEQFFIVGNDGVVAAPGITLDISTVNLTAKTGNPEYKVIYTPESYSLTPSSFLSYVRARKEYKVIADLGEITGSGIYVYSGDLAISSNVTPFNQSYSVVLIVSGTVTISAAPDNTFTPTGTAAIVATTINFDSAITEAHGVFIGRTISTGTNATQGLKIVGNLIAQTTLSNNREWPTTTRPSVFIKFDQAKYISLLPYLSTASYQWRQIQ